MKKIKHFLLMLFVLLSVGVLAQDNLLGSKWSLRASSMAGLRSMGEWGKYTPVRPDANWKNNTESCLTVFQFSIGTAYQYNNVLFVLGEVSFQNSLQKMNFAAQRYLMFGLMGEYRWRHAYAGVGAFVAYDPEVNAFVFFPAGTINASRFHAGPELRAGLCLPISESLTARLGVHCTFGLSRYYDYKEQFAIPPEQRKYDLVHVIPTCLLSMQLEWKIVK